jgi:hypothetical protein
LFAFFGRRLFFALRAFFCFPIALPMRACLRSSWSRAVGHAGPSQLFFWNISSGQPQNITTDINPALAGEWLIDEIIGTPNGVTLIRCVCVSRTSERTRCRVMRGGAVVLPHVWAARSWHCHLLLLPQGAKQSSGSRGRFLV